MDTDIVMSEANYAPLLAQIEIAIARTDKAAEAEGVSLTDSQVRSALHRAGLLVRGGSPVIERETARDRQLAGLSEALVEARKEFRVELLGEKAGQSIPVPVDMWINALRQIQHSIRVRGGEAGTRAYLEFVRKFVAEKLKVEV